MLPTIFQNPFGSFDLRRRPAHHDKSLRAWDAADEYLLETLKCTLAHNCNVLVINDQFGALALALQNSRVCSWNDSRTSHLALLDNIGRNPSTSPFTPELLPGTRLPSGHFDAVLWRIPKTLAHFEHQLCSLLACTDANTIVLAAGMIKHLPKKVHELLQPLGSVEVFAAQKKARVFRIVRNEKAEIPRQPSADSLVVPELQLALSAGPNVFAREKFDIGARFFIEQFAQLPRSARIADLGCGNGVLGLLAKRSQPWAAIDFFDDSYQAVAAAAANYRRNGLADLPPAGQFHVDDVFSAYRGAPFDLILCNPPFHQGHVVGDQIARQMFAQSRTQLYSGGELWVVGNRHLLYHLMLKRIFGNCRQIAANAKFVVLAARA